QHFRTDGTPDFGKAPDGVISYREFTNGQMTKSIRDADTTLTGSGQDFDGISIPSGYSSSGSPIHKKVTTDYDIRGRSTKNADYLAGSSSSTVQRSATAYYTALDDGRLMTLQYAKVDDSGSPTKYYGPVQCTVRNLAGQVEFQGTIALDDNGGEYT